MRTIDLPPTPPDVADLLEQARREDLVVRLSDGSEFHLVAVDDFDRGIARSRLIRPPARTAGGGPPGPSPH